MIRRGTCVLVGLVCLLLSGPRAFAQATASATVEGSTTDKQDKAMVNVSVTLTNKGTGEVRTAKSIETGFYRFDLVPPGNYSVKASSAGFKTVVVDNLEVLVGRTTTVNIKFEPGELSQTVVVSEQAPIIDVTKTNVGTNITPHDIESIPLNGRDFANLAYMVPGAQPVSSYDPTKNRIGIFGINGSGGRNVNITVNGIDDKDSTVGGPVMQLPLTAVQEFAISTQRFSAANGRSEGAAVNVITKSGSNAFHGEAYFFDTQTAFNANDFFDKQSGSPTPQFERQQFGGDIGGPIVKNKMFFFGAVERSREHTSLGVTQQALTELTLAKSIGAQPAQVIPTPYFDWRYNGRVDYRLNDKHTASVSYSGQSNTGLNDQSGQTNDLTAGNFTTNKLIISNFRLTSLFTPRFVNNFTAGYQYWNNVIDTAKKSQFTINFPSGIYFGTNGNVPQQSIQKKWQFKDDVAFSFGAHSFSFGVDYMWIPEVGGTFQFTPVPNLTFLDLPSIITTNTTLYPQGFATPGAVVGMTGAAGNPAFFDLNPKQFGAYFQDDWKVTSHFTVNIGLRWDKDFNLQGGNLQSRSRGYQLLKRIGSPYASHVPTNDNRGFEPRIGFAWDVGGGARHVIRAGYGLYFGNSFQNIPLFMEQQANATIFATVFNITSSGPGDPNCVPATCTVPGTTILLSNWRFGVDPAPVLPAPPTTLPAGATARIMDPNYRNPYAQETNFGYTFSWNSSNAIEISYVHTLGLHEAARININPINPTPANGGTGTGARILDAAFQAVGITPTSTPAEPGIIIDDASIGRSRYDGLDISYRRRMSKNISINAAYVLSRAVGWGGAPAGFGNSWWNPFNIFDPAVDFGYVGNDERHRVSFAAVWQLPWGFEVSPIIQASSPRPVTPVTGQSNLFQFGSSVATAHAVVPVNDPTNFTFYSNLSASSASAAIERNCVLSAQCIQVPIGAARGYSFFNADVRLTKTVRTGDWGKIKLIFQAFDVTNRANFGSNVTTSIRTTSTAFFRKPQGFIAGNGVIVPKSFRAEFGAEFVF